jgi:hypothetical protein
MPEIQSPTPVPRSQLRDYTGETLFNQNYDRQLSRVGALAVTQTVYFMALGLRAGDVVTNLSTVITTGGTTVTIGRMGIYTKTGTRLGFTTNQTTAWESAGVKTQPMSPVLTIPSDDGYYVALVAVSAVTMPTYLVANSTASQNAVVGSGMFPFGVLTGQSDLPSSATVVVGAAPLAIWVAVS